MLPRVRLSPGPVGPEPALPGPPGLLRGGPGGVEAFAQSPPGTGCALESLSPSLE